LFFISFISFSPKSYNFFILLLWIQNLLHSILSFQDQQQHRRSSATYVLPDQNIEREDLSGGHDSELENGGATLSPPHRRVRNHSSGTVTPVLGGATTMPEIQAMFAAFGYTESPPTPVGLQSGALLHQVGLGLQHEMLRHQSGLGLQPGTLRHHPGVGLQPHESVLQEILRQVRYVTAKMRSDDRRDAIKDEWKLLARVIDRMLLIAFLISITTLTASILYIYPTVASTVRDDDSVY